MLLAHALSLSLTFAYAKNGMTVDSYGTIDYYYFFTDTYGCLRLLTRKTETETLLLLYYVKIMDANSIHYLQRINFSAAIIVLRQSENFNVEKMN